MKRKVHWDKEEESDYEDTNASENDESDNEEPRIKDALDGFSRLVSDKRPPIYYTAWRLVFDSSRTVTPKPANNTSDEHFRARRICYSPHNDDIVKPHALKIFIDGLAELGINKRLIQNERILAELSEKAQAHPDKDSEAGDKEMVSESSDNEDDTETASEISDQESENPDLEPEGNSDVSYSEETASSEILLKVKGPIATERTFTKEQ